MRSLVALTILCSGLVSATTVMYEVGSPKLINIHDQIIKKPSYNNIKVEKFSVDKLYIARSLLTEGAVKSKQLKDLADAQPFFVVGYGPNSLKWLKENSLKLKEINALPLAVNLKSKSEYQELQHAFNGDFIVTNMDHFKKAYSINHYPFLIANGWVEQ